MRVMVFSMLLKLQVLVRLLYHNIIIQLKLLFLWKMSQLKIWLNRLKKNILDMKAQLVTQKKWLKL